MPDAQTEERRVAGSGAQGAVEALPYGPGHRCARIDRPRVVVRAGVWLGAAAKPLGRAAKAVEVRMAHDRVDAPDALDDLGRDHFGTRPVLRLGREDESPVL